MNPSVRRQLARLNIDEPEEAITATPQSNDYALLDVSELSSLVRALLGGFFGPSFEIAISPAIFRFVIKTARMHVNIATLDVVDWEGLSKWLSQQDKLLRHRLVSNESGTFLELFVPVSNPDSSTPHWNAFRKDRLSGSQLMSLKNATGALSSDRPQLIVIHAHGRLLPVPLPNPDDLGTNTRKACERVQLIVGYVRATCLLAPSAVVPLIAELAPLSQSNQNILLRWPSAPALLLDALAGVEMIANGVNVAPWVRMAIETPWFPNGTHLRQHLSEGNMAHTFRKSTHVEDYLRNNGYHFVAVRLKYVWTPDRIGYDQTSVILPQAAPGIDPMAFRTTDGSLFYRQVIILQQRVAIRRSVILVSSRTINAFTPDNIVEILVAAARQLKWSGGSPAITMNRFAMTVPLEWTMFGESRLFHSNGSLNTHLASMRLVQHMRDLGQFGLFGEGPQQQEQEAPVTTAPQDRLEGLKSAVSAADLVILYIRASTVQQTETSAGLERQIVSMVEDLRTAAPQNLLVGVEYCSTSQHPWKDRKLMKLLYRQIQEFRNPILLTVNADRLTQRESDLEAITEEFHSRNLVWWAQGNVVNPATWQQFSAHPELTHQLLIGREMAIQHGFYTRCVAVQLRINNSASDSSITTISTWMREVCRGRRLVGLVRVSPSFRVSEDPPTNNSLDRQATFLKALVGRGISQWERLLGVSAYSGEALDRLETTLASFNESCVVVLPSVDRLIRKPEQLPRLQAILAAGQHIIVSFLWSYDSLDVLGDDDDEGLQWISSVSVNAVSYFDQRRIGNNALALPVIWPMMWFNGEDCNPAVFHAASKAQDFIAGFRTSSWQGDRQLAIPQALQGLNTSGKRGFHDRQKVAWDRYIRGQLPNTNLLGLIDVPSTAWICSCPENSANHDRDCVCDCMKCTAHRWAACSCSSHEIVRTANRTAMKRLPAEICRCSAACPCICEYCHKEGSAARGKKRQRAEFSDPSTTQSSQSQQGAVFSSPPSASEPISERNPLSPLELASSQHSEITSDLLPPASWPSTAGPSTAGPSTAGRSTARRSTAGPSTAGPSTAGPSTAGPSTAGPSTAGPSTGVRMCEVPNCPNPAPVGGGGGKKCPSCYKAALQARKVAAGANYCSRPGCPNRVRNQRTTFCSVECYVQQTPNPKRCRDCDKVVLPGFGNACETHVTRTKRAKKAKK